MKSIKLTSLLIAALFLIFSSCSKDSFTTDNKMLSGLNTGIVASSVLLDQSPAVTCGTPVTFTLWAGQTINAGTVTVINDANNLYVTYKTTAPWMLKETHLYVGASAGVPVNSQGIPVPGQFPYSDTYSPYKSEVTYQIPLSSVPECFVVYSHCVVAQQTVSGEVTQTGWAGDHQFSTSRWGFYFDYCKQPCDQPPQRVVAFKAIRAGGQWVCTGGGLENNYFIGYLDFLPDASYKLWVNGKEFGEVSVGNLTIQDFNADGEMDVKVDNLDNTNFRFMESYLFVGAVENFNVNFLSYPFQEILTETTATPSVIFYGPF